MQSSVQLRVKQTESRITFFHENIYFRDSVFMDQELVYTSTLYYYILIIGYEKFSHKVQFNTAMSNGERKHSGAICTTRMEF